MKIIYLLPLFLLGCSPKTYEDCILKEMKGTTEKVAAIYIQKACRAKFPEVETGKIIDTFSYSTLQESIWDTEFTHGSKVEINEIHPNKESIKVTNKNDETISNVTIGTPITSTCNPDKNSYSQLIQCKGEISANATDRMDCQTSIPDNVSVCIVSVEYQAWIDTAESPINKANLQVMPKPSIWQKIKEML